MATPALSPEPRLNRTERVLTLALVLSVAILPFLLAIVMTWLSGVPYPRRNGQMWLALLQQVNGMAVLAFVLYKRNDLSALIPSLRLATIGNSFVLLICGYLASGSTRSFINTAHWLWTSEPAKFTNVAQLLPTGVPVILVLYILSSPVFEELIVRWFLTEELIGLGLNWVLAAIGTAVLQASYLPGDMERSRHLSVVSCFRSLLCEEAPHLGSRTRALVDRLDRTGDARLSLGVRANKLLTLWDSGTFARLTR